MFCFYFEVCIGDLFAGDVGGGGFEDDAAFEDIEHVVGYC